MITAGELRLREDPLRNAVTSDVDLLAAASDHIIRSGGKRLRPKLVLLAYKAAGGQDVSQVVPLAAAVELLHTASLVHDDINDHSELRRGQATVNARWGNGLALLVGDFVFVRLLQLIADFDPRMIRVLADCCTAIVEGETLQVLHLRDVDMTEETYFRIVVRKTATLFSACTELGAFLAGAPKAHVGALKEYGLNLGIAFQIRDDTLDLIGKEASLGKPTASDVRQGKMSLATLFALRRSERAREVLLSEGVDTLRTRTPRTRQIVELLRGTGAIAYATQQGQAYAEKAKEPLSILSESVAKAELLRLADFALIRDQ